MRPDVLDVFDDADDRSFICLIVPIAHVPFQKRKHSWKLRKIPAFEAVHDVVRYHASIVVVASFWLAAPGLQVLLPSRADRGADSEERRNSIRNFYPRGLSVG